MSAQRPRHHRLRSGLAVTAVLAGLVGTAVTPAHADDPESRLMIVLDASGSMNESASGGGGTRMESAKTALTSVIDGLPASQQVGFRVFGSQISNEHDPAACTDSKLVVPIDSGQADTLKKAVTDTTPKGETPIGFALQEAGTDLGKEGPRTIVLVSDGESTCAPPPCDVARELSAQGVNVSINVVGFDVSGAARETLQCIAGAGNGSYYDVASTADLTRTLSTLTTRAARVSPGVGQPVTGTPTTVGAPTITEGRWLDELSTDAASLTKYYSTKRTMPGSTIVVSARLRTQGNDMESSDVTIETMDGDSCNAYADSLSSQPGAMLSGAAAAGPFDYNGAIDTEEPCGTASDLIIKVENEYATARFARPLEITVTEVPPASNLTSLPAPADSHSWASPPQGTQGPKVIGGANFDDAPVLKPGTYIGEIVPGELQTFQVAADWGQTVSASVDFPEPADEALQAAIRDNNPWVDLAIFGANGANATASIVDGAPGASDILSTVNETHLGVQSPPIRYRNLAADNSGDLGASTPGVYTVAVHVTPDEQGQTYKVPFLLHVGVTGNVNGAPALAGKEIVGGVTNTDPTEAAEASDDRAGNASQGAFALTGLVKVGLIGFLGVAGLLAVLGAVILFIRRARF